LNDRFSVHSLPTSGGHHTTVHTPHFGKQCHNVQELSDFRNKDREIEDAEERHQMEIKVYKQKVKHLLYEHQNNLSELKVTT